MCVCACAQGTRNEGSSIEKLARDIDMQAIERDNPSVGFFGQRILTCMPFAFVLHSALYIHFVLIPPILLHVQKMPISNLCSVPFTVEWLH